MIARSNVNVLKGRTVYGFIFRNKALTAVNPCATLTFLAVTEITLNFAQEFSRESERRAASYFRPTEDGKNIARRWVMGAKE